MIGEIQLQWPNPVLLPNKRIHWAAKNAATRSARTNAAWATRAVGLTKLDLASLKITVTFQPPDRRKRDLDSMLASLKPALDGIADVIGIDDSNFELAIRKVEPVKHGAVRIQLECV